MLQKLGPSCVAAYNAYTMCADLPKVAFLAMDARHCAGTEMAELMAYAASVGSERARRKDGAVGFRSEEHTSELPSLMRLPYAVFCVQNKTTNTSVLPRQQDSAVI